VRLETGPGSISATKYCVDWAASRIAPCPTSRAPRVFAKNGVPLARGSTCPNGMRAMKTSDYPVGVQAVAGDMICE